jgi:hypothetical protein
MQRKRQTASLILISWVAFAFILDSSTQAQETAPAATKVSSEQAREENAYTLGVQAYLWGYPLRFYGGMVPSAVKVGGSYVNDFRKFTDVKTAKDRFVVTPNNVTIDGYCDFDTASEPVVVFVPKLPSPRWYIVQIGDSFDEIIHNVGGIKGEQPGVYLITGPDFAGDVPGDMIQVKSRTRQGPLALRIFVNGTADLPKAREAQSGFQVMPLSAYLRYGLGYKRPAQRVMVPAYQSTARKIYDTSTNSATGCMSSYR